MPLPSGLRKCETQRFTIRLVQIATLTQPTSLYESLLHVLKHKVLKSASPIRDSSMAVPQIQKLILREIDCKKRPQNESPEVATFWLP